MKKLGKSEFRRNPIRLGDVAGRRTQLQQYFDVLLVIYNETKFKKGGIRKTQLMYKTNVNTAKLTSILNDLVENNLIITNPTQDKRRHSYRLTEHGEDFLMELKNDLERIKSACLIWLNREVI